MNGIYLIAGRSVSISSVHEDVHILCQQYRSDMAQELEVNTIQSDIDFEREKSAAEDRLENNSIRNFSDGYLETLAVYRKIAELLIKYDILLFHGSVISVDDTGYLFTAKSGTGKSTHTGLWRKLLGQRAVMVNDDKPLIQINDSSVTVYGTPWDGKHRLSTNMSVPLRAICILQRGTENQINQITRQEAYAMLIQQSYRPSEPQKLKKTLELVDRMAGIVNLYSLRCNMDIQAAQIAYETMKG